MIMAKEVDRIMYKVLLVDDEYYIRQRLATCIDWEEEGFTISGSVQSADEALRLLGEQAFDLAIVDISMPQKDGLTMIKELRENHIPVKIMILSGYGTFEYAQKAIKYDIKDYLLKPIEEEELIKALQKLKYTLDSEQELKQIHQRQSQANRQLGTIKKEIYFQKIFTNHQIALSDIHTLERQLEEYGLTDDLPWRIFVFDLQSIHLQTCPLEDIQLYQYAAANVVNELFADYFQKYILAADVFSHGVLICSQAVSDSEISRCLDHCVKTVREVLNLDICFGCSSLFHLSLQNLNGEYNRAVKAYALSNLREMPYVFYEFSEENSLVSFEVLKNLEKLDAAFSSKEKMKLETALNELFASINIQVCSYFALDQILSRIVVVCYNQIEKISFPLEESDDLSFLQGYKELLLAGYNLEYIKNKIIQLCLSMVMSQPASGNARQELINQAVNYINAHFTRCDISLSLISQNVLINASYLSSMFKKEKGISVSQYITKLRMEKAKEFLANDQLPLKEIAERIGYNDVFYFSKVFKRYFGVSPSTYRN